MILIQVILIGAILFVVLKFLTSRNSSQTQAWKKMLLLVFGLTAVILILFPNILDGLANFVGVGRGADLLLYGLTVAFIFEQFNNYIKSKEEHKKLVILARKIAIAQALREKEDKNG